jgi:hypothetical protein
MPQDECNKGGGQFELEMNFHSIVNMSNPKIPRKILHRAAIINIQSFKKIPVF